MQHGGGMHTERATLDAVAVPDGADRLTVRLIRPVEHAPRRVLMARHHYLGFRGLVGGALYCVVCIDDQWIACWDGPRPHGCVGRAAAGSGGRGPSNGRGCAMSRTMCGS